MGERLGEKLGENEIKILESISSNPQITIKQLYEKLQISTTAVENNIKKLKDKLVESLRTLSTEPSMDTPCPVNTPPAGGFCGSTPISEAYILSRLRMGHGWCGQTITTIQKPYSTYLITFDIEFRNLFRITSTTGIAAYRNNRIFIGIDSKEEYLKHSVDGFKKCEKRSSQKTLKKFYRDD
ncbi:MAG: winged helix-turn-helix transcriptional regulator [Candidatus Saliniplasma sp.]